MAGNNGTRIQDGISGRVAVILAAIGGVFGGFSGPILLVKFGGDSVVRPDPFTGTQGRLIERRIESLEEHVRNHPDQTGRFDARLSALEAQNSIILTNQGQMIDRLDHLSDRSATMRE